MKIIDAIVVGGGAGGSIAALYLARFNRSVIVFDDSQSRMRLIGKSFNYPTYKDGISGPEIISRLHAQAASYGAEFFQSRVVAITPQNKKFLVATETGEWFASSIILATGVRDVLPPIHGIETAIREGWIGVCPVCHAYESNGKSVAVLSNTENGVKEAVFLTLHARSVTLLDVSDNGLKVANPSIQHVRITIQDISLDKNACCLRQDFSRRFEHLYCALGRIPNNQLALALGVNVTNAGCIKVNEFQETSVSNVFAVGDVVNGLDQMIVAEAEAAIAACHLNLRLGRE